MKNMWHVTASIIALMSGAAQGASNYCGELKGSLGPFDYRLRSEVPMVFKLVEGAHFTENIENGIKGETSSIGGDLDYTLRVFPNHSRALAALARYAVRTKSVQLPYATYPVECYFDRAMRFTPNDGKVRSEYANYLFALGKTERAFALYRSAVDLEPENATINYNVGLAYLRMQDYGNALAYAQKAYLLGFPLQGLKNKLIGVGKWVEPKPPQPAVAAPVEAPAPVAPSDKPAG